MVGLTPRQLFAAFAGALLLATSLVAHEAERRTDVRYLVLEIDANDVVRLLDSKRVSIAADPSPAHAADASRMRVASESDVVEASLVGADGAVIARQAVALDRHLRAEFTTSPDGAIEGRWLPRERTPFVVRLPAAPAAFVDLRVTESGRTQRFAVAELDRRARLRSESADASPPFETRSTGANSANRLDLLVLGDGYTAAESATFYKDVERIVGSFLGVEPYASYSNFVNVSTLFVPSRQSGADHPLCDDGGADPKEGTTVDTAFDATFCTSGIQRLLTVNYGKVLTAAAAIPDWDKIIVIVNDTMYGGAGGTFSVSSTHMNGVEILQHEYGHSFARLADEYDSPYPSYPLCSDRAPGPPCEANVTDVPERAAIKWAPWILPSTPVPTAWPIVDAIGLFEGARYKSTGMYRPKHDCLMNHLGQPFCSVCAEAYVRRLYTGWNGIPAAGIDLIEPGTEMPAASQIAVSRGTAVTFSAQLLQPLRGGVNARWLVDGAVVAGNTGSSFVFVPEAEGTFTIELQVTDATPLVLAAIGTSPLTKTRRWVVTVGDQPPPPARRRAVRS